MTRPVIAGLILAALVAALVPAAAAPAKPKKETPKKEEPKEDKAGGKQLEVFDDWTASLAGGKNKTCYALARPKARAPEGKHEQAYIFIADRPAEKVHDEVSVVMGFPIKEGSIAKAKAGRASFDLVAGASAFFTKGPAEDKQFADALKHAGVLTIKAPPLKGSDVTDTYSLKGFGKALERAQKECR